MEEVPEKERQRLKELIDKDFGFVELATNAGRDVKKERGHCYCPQHLQKSRFLAGGSWNHPN
jgi:hypothetical protein